MTETNTLPLYLKLKDRILEEYQDMSYYSPLPGERELCEQFGVSRPTVRKTLQLLEEERKIARIPGKGSFFLGNRIYVDSSKSDGFAFYNEVVSRGGYTRSKILLQNIESAVPHIATKLKIAPDEEVFHLERLRYIGDELYSIANAYVPIRLCPQLIRIDFTNQSLYQTLESFGIHPYRCDKVLEIRPSGAYEARHLGIGVGDPVSFMQTTTMDKEGRIIECADSKSLAYKTRYEMVAYNRGCGGS